MIHRHLTSSGWTRMELESLFDRGTLEDWREFAKAMRRDRSIAVETLRVCEYRESDGAEGIARALVEHAHPDLRAPGLPVQPHDAGRPDLRRRR